MTILSFGTAEEYVSAMSEKYIDEQFERRNGLLEEDTMRELHEEVKLYQQEWRNDWKREYAANR